MTHEIDWATPASCALDFCRALQERGKIRNWIFKLLVGKYAYREYELLRFHLGRSGFDLDMDYGLERCNYHTRTMKQIEEGFTNEP